MLSVVAAFFFRASQVKLVLSQSKEQNPQQAEQGHAQMQQCIFLYFV